MLFRLTLFNLQGPALPHLTGLLLYHSRAPLSSTFLPNRPLNYPQARNALSIYHVYPAMSTPIFAPLRLSLEYTFSLLIIIVESYFQSALRFRILRPLRCNGTRAIIPIIL